MKPVTITQKKIKLKFMTFEQALASLRRGKAIRRRTWHPESCIFRLGRKVFVKLPDTVSQTKPGGGPGYGSRPDFWLPYPQDFLALDWEVVK